MERASSPGRSGGLRRPVTLLAGAAVLAGFAGWAGVQAHDLRAARPPANIAITDRAATSQVIRRISAAIGTVFSYSYADPATTRQAAQHLLTGPAIRQYDRLFTLVEQRAPAERLVLVTRVTNIGVELLTGDRARLLIFVAQQDRAGTGKAVYSGSMLAVTAIRGHGQWLIEDIQTFS